MTSAQAEFEHLRYLAELEAADSDNAPEQDTKTWTAP